MAKGKPKSVDEPFDELDALEFDPISSAKKMPINITNGLEPLSDFMKVPCSKLIPYRGKKESDFKEWPEDKFLLLMESIRANGVIEPITVRMIDGKFENFEILAGEHRWKASQRLGLKTIPAHVMRDCDDEMAEAIFALTNIIRRENSIIDKVNGWWHYLRIVRYKRENQIEQLRQEGVLNFDIAAKAQETGERTIYRYAKLHDLIAEFFELLDQSKLGITAGEFIAYIEQEKQKDLIPYKEQINNRALAQDLYNLSTGKIDGKEWTKENIEELILNSSSRPKRQREKDTKISSTVFQLLPESLHSQANEIVKKALEEYLSQHPDLANNTT